jgi:hypothetical protein
MGGEMVCIAFARKTNRAKQSNMQSILLCVGGPTQSILQSKLPGPYTLSAVVLP